MMDKTIAIMMPRIVRGGAETQFRYLVNHLSEKGYRVVLFLEIDYGAKDEEYYLYQIARNVIVESFKWNYFTASNEPKSKASKILKIGKAYADMVRMIIKYNIQCIISYSRMSIILTPLFRLFGIKHIFSERNSGEMISMHRLYAPLLKGKSTIICNSMYAKNIYEKNGFENVTFIANGIASEEYTKHTEKKELKEQMRILIPARICPGKNQEVVLKAVKSVCAERIVLDFAGSVEDIEYQKLLQDICDKLPDNIQVNWCGFLKNLKEGYAGYDLVILPSYVEGMPNVLLESLSASVMVLYSNIPMNIDVMGTKDGSFAPDDSQALAELIQNWIEKSCKERFIVVQQLRDAVLKNYTFDRMVDQYAQVIQGVLSK